MSAANSNPVERLKYAIAFVFAGLHIGITQRKPFNPILGETLEAEFFDGTKVYVEHTSHHPPISNYLLIGKGWKYYGRQEFCVKNNTTFNCVDIVYKGPQVIEYTDGHRIYFKLPVFKMANLIIGDLNQKFVGVLKFIDPKNNLKAVIAMNKKFKGGVFGMQNKKQYDQCEGKIYLVNTNTMQQDVLTNYN